MKGSRPFGILLLPALWAASAWAQQNSPHLAYAYPAGGQLGTTVPITVGGQFLAGVTNACVTGPGVRGEMIEYRRPMAPKEFNDLREEWRQLQERRRLARTAASGTHVWTPADEMRIAEIRDKILKNPPNRQLSPALAETVTFRVTIATNASPGMRELRLQGPNALSNPIRFCVGQLPELAKPPAQSLNPDLAPFLERLGRKPAGGTPRSETRVTLPATVNGQILPGGVDRYRFRAGRGQHLVVSVDARALTPYLADAVPGWFEATLTLCDPAGKELAHAGRFRFHPDPVLHFQVPRDGEYAIEIRDALYRGREDFVYRMSLGELPFITDIFPLGGPAGVVTAVELKGWNLPVETVTVRDTGPQPGIHEVSAGKIGLRSNLAPFAVDTLPEILEQEPNDSPASAQAVTLPVIVNGRIDARGDGDVFRFEGHAGDRIVAEVHARRLDSPLDSVLRLTDGAGRQLAFNDDYEDNGAGLETHHADSRLSAELPAPGSYYVHVGDVQHQGGAEYAYRLRLSAPRPDFALRVVPASVAVRAGMSAPVTVHALRRDGFTNAIVLALRNAPPGFALSGARVPENQDKAQFTLKAPSEPTDEPVNLALEGSATIEGRLVVHPAVPAEEMMQAFAYRHLVPAEAWAVAVVGNPRPFAPGAFRILSAVPLRIPVGGTARLRMATPSNAFVDRFDLELSGAPAGISIRNIAPIPRGVELILACDAGLTRPGLSGNLIVNVLPRNPLRPQNAASPGGRPRNPAGTLPAVPFEIVPE